MSGKEKSRITKFGNKCLTFSMAWLPLLASMQKSKPPPCSKSVRRPFWKELSLATMSTVEMFPFILGAAVDKPAEHETFLACKWPACRQSRGLLLKWSAHNIFFHHYIHLTAHGPVILHGLFHLIAARH